MLPSQQEKAIYVIKKDKKKAIIPNTLLLIFLGVVFYLGILINVSLLELTAKQETLAKTISLVVVIFLIITGIIFTIMKSKRKYTFYSNKLVLRKRQILYSEINQIEIKHNFLDKIFKTYSIRLSEGFIIQYVSEKLYPPQQIEDYLNQLVWYSRRV